METATKSSGVSKYGSRGLRLPGDSRQCQDPEWPQLGGRPCSSEVRAGPNLPWAASEVCHLHDDGAEGPLTTHICSLMLRPGPNQSLGSL